MMDINGIYHDGYKKIKIHFTIALMLVMGCFLFSIFLIKDQYDNDLIKLRKETESQKKQITKLKKDNEEKNLVIESLLDGVECNCGWYEDFYYEHAAELGAYE